MITFLELRIQKKSEKRPQKWARNSDPFLVPLSIGIFPEGSENGRILGPAFWCWRTTFELIFGIAQSGRGATISSATCSRRTPKCSQLMLALNTYSFQTIKLKLAAFLPSAAPTVKHHESICSPQASSKHARAPQNMCSKKCTIVTVHGHKHWDLHLATTFRQYALQAFLATSFGELGCR